MLSAIPGSTNCPLQIREQTASSVKVKNISLGLIAGSPRRSATCATGRAVEMRSGDRRQDRNYQASLLMNARRVVKKRRGRRLFIRRRAQVKEWLVIVLKQFHCAPDWTASKVTDGDGILRLKQPHPEQAHPDCSVTPIRMETNCNSEHRHVCDDSIEVREIGKGGRQMETIQVVSHLFGMIGRPRCRIECSPAR